MKARDVAVAVMSDVRAGRRTAKRSLDELIGRYRIVPADVGLAGELLWGVMRHRLTLEAVLRPALDARWDRISASIQHILLVAVYQLMWLDGVPAFAAINEAVEQAKREGGNRAGGFVNAVLRAVQRQIVSREDREPTGDPRCCVRTGPDRYCRFGVPVLPDPAVEPVAWLSAATSHPEALVGRWVGAFGRERAEAICTAGMRHPPLVLRPNVTRTDAAGLAERLKAEGCEVEIVTLDAGGDLSQSALASGGRREVVVASGGAGHGRLAKLAAFREGLFQPQDITAMHPVWALGLEGGAVVLDLCAGYGTKATQAAEEMRACGRVIASDSDPDKLVALTENCTRLGLTCVRTAAPGELPALAASLGRLDVILIDVPCSNTGVLARRPEARYRFAPAGLASLTRMQADLLRRAAELARPETRLCYSTCSVEPEENEALVGTFCQARPDWRVFRSQLTLPQCGSSPADWRDGGFFAVLVRE